MLGGRASDKLATTVGSRMTVCHKRWEVQTPDATMNSELHPTTAMRLPPLKWNDILDWDGPVRAIEHAIRRVGSVLMIAGSQSAFFSRPKQMKLAFEEQGYQSHGCRFHQRMHPVKLLIFKGAGNRQLLEFDHARGR
jgi:hypothetical protein